MGIELEIADMIAKSFGETQIEYIDSIMESGEKIPESLKEACEYTKRYPKLFDYVRKLSGLPKSFGVHPCGRVASVDELDYYLPSSYDENGVRYLHGDQHDVEDVGLVKVDILGLRTLDQEYDALEMSGNGEEFINPKQKYDDDKVWEVFRSGDTGGIFQFSSKGMKETLKKMNASSIDELSIANALFRPGAMAHIDEYCNRKHGKEEVTYYHPDLEPILKNTYGIIVFQEQLIQIARLAKMRNPDILRKMVGKKSAALIPVVKPELHDGLIARGWSEEQFNTLWEVILASCSYMFNKCVSGDTRFAGNIITIEQQYKAGIYTRAFSRCDNGDVRFNDVLNIQQSGVRQLYEVETETGRWVECTDNHQFPTPKGKKKLSELRVGDELYIFNHYDRGLRGGRTGTDKISAIRPTKKAMTYDVTMTAPNHNFIVNNGLVVSNSHSSAYAILAYMTAKLKAYYPAEFFAGLLNSYIGESNFVKDTGDEIFADIARHKISFIPFSFRNDHRKCSVKDGKIVYALPLVRDMNTETAEILYKNRDFEGDYFFELLFKLYEDGLRKSALSKLILLDMFPEFGNSRQLQLILDACEFIKWGEKEKMLKKTAAKNAELDKIISNYSTDLNARGEITATYSNIKWDDVLIEYEMKARAAGIPDVNIKVKVVNQKEMIGLAPFPTGRDEDRSLLFVTDVKPLCNHATGSQFGYSVFTSSFGSGIRSRFTVKGKQYREWDENPIHQNDIIRCLGYQNERGYFNLTLWKKVYT